MNINPKIQNSTLTQSRLKSLVVYDETNGLLWKELPHFNTKGIVGGPIGAYHRSSGYVRVQIDGKRYTVHMLVWLYHFGEYPKTDIDHIDTDKTNNLIGNLRLAEEKNTWNTAKPKHNTSGFKGVTWHEKSGKWLARVGCIGVTYRLGSFLTAEAANKAVEEKRTQLHGEFVNHG